jgi:DNA replication protein DnaC
MLTKFKLVDIKNNYQVIIDEAAEKNISYKEFLINLIKSEEEGKKERLMERNIRLAHFDNMKTLESFDFGFHEWQYMQKIKELASLSFMNNNENIILIGPPGVGKSHLAVGIGIKACEVGKKVLFTNASDLFDELLRSANTSSLKIKLKRLAKIDLLIIDELAYLKMDKEKESIFFQLIRHRYEKNSLIITTNLPLGKWDEIFTNQLAATAILDRLIHHGHVISITGDSYRVKGAKA